MKIIFFEKIGEVDYRISGQVLPINSIPLFCIDSETYATMEIWDGESIKETLNNHSVKINDFFDNGFDINKVNIITDSMLNHKTNYNK